MTFIVTLDSDYTNYVSLFVSDRAYVHGCRMVHTAETSISLFILLFVEAFFTECHLVIIVVIIILSIEIVNCMSLFLTM